MDRDLEALDKARRHVADIARLAEMAEEHLRERRFEDAEACLRLIQEHPSTGKDALGQDHGCPPIAVGVTSWRTATAIPESAASHAKKAPKCPK